MRDVRKRNREAATLVARLQSGRHPAYDVSPVQSTHGRQRGRLHITCETLCSFS
jgi:hypothetical protein